MKFRYHRGSLADSMHTAFEGTRAQVEGRLQAAGYSQLHFGLYMDEPDHRIGWDRTFVITARHARSSDQGVVGFADSDADLAEPSPLLPIKEIS